MHDIILLAAENPIPDSLWNIIQPALRLIAGIALVWSLVSVVKNFLGGKTVEAVRRIVIVVIAMVFLFDPGILFTLIDVAQNIVNAVIDAISGIASGDGGGGGNTGGNTGGTP